ncbi:hypothetical protein CDD83_8463 [Cordyceps sp. RAO-2017]|nr:hypothetical protein CDD83_8463 [Cordyceps sp. RAO-2017]
MNFRDVIIATGDLDVGDTLSEAVGVVTEIGSRVKLFDPGDRVMRVSMDPIATMSRGPETSWCPVPVGLSMEQAATVQLSFATAYRALVELARLAAGESLLIHCATGGVGLACIQLATHLGAIIYCTAGTEAT